ncbi:MAG: family 43 glycosylhydrolase [Clostridiales bacterium]|nr:family 43 glycosylhydrolase [Clostridiales bacterium]
MNPLLPRQYFIPDGEAHVMSDGRLYLYGSLDISGANEYCSKQYRVFSTDDPKLENWIDHGISFSNTKDDCRVPFSPDTGLYAPDAIEYNGKYYLFICGGNSFEAVAVSDKPEGPFGTAVPIPIANHDSIDPAIFIDDDGQAYYFWGQFNLKGAKMNPDMHTLDESSINRCLLSETEHGFHEGSSVRKRDGKYYIVYTDISRGKATCMSYAVSDHPLGPYKKGGVIIDNIYCDNSTWNDHGSITEFKGQWYVFYHRSSQNSIYSRRMCAEPIFFNDDGSIDEVIMTSQGASDPINAFSEIDASVACRMKGNVKIMPILSPDGSINEILTDCGGGNWLNDWAEYRYFDFSSGVSEIRVKSSGKGTIIIKAPSGVIAGKISVDSKIFKETSGIVTGLSGVLPIWLEFEGTGMSLDSFTFK